METKKRNALTIQQKLNIINDLESGLSNSVVCTKYKLPKSTISTVFKNRNKIKNSSSKINVTRQKKIRKPVRDDIDKALFKWFTIQRTQNNPITGAILQTKAEELARLMHEEGESGSKEFVCTKGWLDRFKLRHGITAGKIHGEAAAVSTEVTSEWLESRWPVISAGYDMNDIFNGDETGLFYKMTPDKTLKFKGEKCAGGKQSKERITVWVCANMTGTEKRPLMVIGKSKTPRCFKNKGRLPVSYESNQRAWVTSEIFERLLQKWNDELRKRERKVLLIVDNCPAHPRLENLEFIKLVFLPPNVTAVLQPMDQGVIHSLKLHYRKMFLVQLISAFESNENFKFTLFDAIIMITAAWRKVSSKTIENCFRHAGFKPLTIQGYDDEDDIPLARLRELQQEQETLVDQDDEEDVVPLSEWIKNHNNVDLEEYTKMDNDLLTTDFPSDTDLVNSVKILVTDEVMESENEEEEEVDDEDVPTLSQSLSSLNVVSKFIHCTNADPSVYQAFDKLYGYIERHSLLKNKVQNKMTDYFKVQNKM